MVVGSEYLEPVAVLPAGGLDIPELSRELDAVRERSQIIEARIEQLNQALIASRREESLLEDLIAVRKGEPPRFPRVQPSSRQSSSSDAVEATIESLLEAGRPMHIGELMVALKSRNVRIPGSGQQANLISHLRRDERIVRPSRGVYGLREWGLEDAPRPRKRGSVKKKKTRSSGQGKLS